MIPCESSEGGPKADDDKWLNEDGRQSRGGVDELDVGWCGASLDELRMGIGIKGCFRFFFSFSL